MRGLFENSCVYVAVCGDLVKVGTSCSMKLRTRSLRSHHGKRFEIVKSWPHDDGYAIEMMVLRSLAFMGYDRIHKEVYRAPVLTAKREIGRAIKCYAERQFDRSSNPEEIRRWWGSSRFPCRTWYTPI